MNKKNLPFIILGAAGAVWVLGALMGGGKTSKAWLWPLYRLKILK